MKNQKDKSLFCLAAVLISTTGTDERKKVYDNSRFSATVVMDCQANYKNLYRSRERNTFKLANMTKAQCFQQDKSNYLVSCPRSSLSMIAKN